MTLSLCMIVKNEQDVLARALATAAIYADEIIIVDTGSTDRTVETAKKYTDKVYSFEWNDDFSAARNFAVSKAACGYWMWLDADDTVSVKAAKSIARLKNSLDPAVDIVMLPYVLTSGADGKPTFSYYRERIIKNRSDFVWRGRVHEAVVMHGSIIRGKPEIVHAKPPDKSSGTRNLDIYMKKVALGEPFEPRETYYFARELYYNGHIEKAAERFREFLHEPNGFSVNKTDACLMLSRCLVKLGNKAEALAPLYDSFNYGLPTGEVCCEIAMQLFSLNQTAQAAYWFESALRAKPDIASGAFVDKDCYGFLPCIWLSVCYDKMGNYRKAYRYHCRARKLNPEHPSVIANQKYFHGLGF